MTNFEHGIVELAPDPGEWRGALRDCLHVSRKEAKAARWTFRRVSPGYFRMGFVMPVFGQEHTAVEL